MRVRFWLATGWLCVLGSIPAMGQSTLGTILGAIQDQSGASLPGVRVTAANMDTGATRTETSNDSGQYQFPNMPPGTYAITAQKSGFVEVKTDRVTLDARQERRVDLKMGVATVQQTIEVTAEAATVNTENANISSTISNTVVTDLPMNYRGASSSPLAAIAAMPNVQQDQNGAIALTGSLPFMTDYSVDGTSNVNVQRNGPSTNMYPSTEMLSEFKVSAINNNAEMASSADVTVTTKGGTNAWHGSAFEYLQNRALDATTYGANTKPAKVWNDFGGSFSGPVVIPKLYNGHNKTFFFVDYEGNRKPGSQLTLSNVPTTAMVEGNLNGVPGPAALNPYTGAPFPNNQIPPSLLNPVAQKLLTTYYPAPNYDSGSTVGDYRSLERLANQTDGYDIRGDQIIGNRNQFFVRWSWKDLPFQAPASGGTSQLLPPVTYNEADRNLVLSDSYTITPHIVNEFRFGYSHLHTGTSYPFSGASVVQSLGLTGLDLSHAGADGGFPGFNFSAGTGFSSIGHGDIGPSSSKTIQFTDNVTWVAGKHTLKFGVDFRSVSYTTVNNFGLSDEFGSLNFSGTFSGNAFADLLLGLPTFNGVFDIGPLINENSQHFATYGQDEWRVSKSLTLSFGLRWELQPPFTERNGNIANFNPANGGLVYPDIAAKVLPPAASVLYSINQCPGIVNTLPCSPVQTASQAGLPQGLRYTYYGDYDPRIGAAWRPFGDKTVFRAGFGLFTVPTLGGVAYQMTGTGSTNSPFYFNALVNNTPLFQLPSVAYGNGGLVPADVGTYTFDVAQQIHYKDPASAQWNVTIEQQFWQNWTARISYIGNNSYRLPLTTDQNSIRASKTPFSPSEEPYPQWAAIYQLGNWGFANYQDMELQLSHRFANNFFLQATYDWAKDLSDANNDAPAAYGSEQGNFTGPLGFVVGVDDRFNLHNNRGNAPGDRRQRFLLSGIYQLPFGKGRKYLANANRLVNGALGGWQVSSLILAETGPYLTAFDGNPLDSQSNLNEVGRPAVVRPDQVASCDISNPTPGEWFNTNAFVLTPAGAGRTGNAGVGNCEGPGTVTVAAGLSKVFVAKEHLRVRFESTFTNMFNHPNFAPPASMDVSSLSQFGGNTATSSFGVVQSVQSSENAGNRVGQLSLRLEF